MSYVLTTDGEYYIRLQAVSLFDEGSWTKFQVTDSGFIITASGASFFFIKSHISFSYSLSESTQTRAAPLW